MADQTAELLPGTLDMLILNTLALTPRHGVGIARRIEQVTRGTFQVKPGSLFPALHRMEEAGWVSSEWGETDTGRRAKFYRLSAAGRRQLEKETARWGRASLAINRALGAES
jgi:transcriptional regulator